MNFSNMLTPEDYQKAAFLSRMVAEGLLNRLRLMKLQPQYIIDIGCGVGTEVHILRERYPEARVYGVDLAESFLQYGKKEQKAASWGIVADSALLPFSLDSVDLIFANLLLPWVENPTAILGEWRRILRPHGVLLFSCLGPATFQEWQTSEKVTFLPSLIDMHHVGDALLAEGFADPVLETEELTFTYRQQEKLQMELEKSGMSAPFALEQLLATEDSVFSVTFEVVYAHAFCPSMKGFKPDQQGITRIPVSQLKK